MGGGHKTFLGYFLEYCSHAVISYKLKFAKRVPENSTVSVAIGLPGQGCF